MIYIPSAVHQRLLIVLSSRIVTQRWFKYTVSASLLRQAVTTCNRPTNLLFIQLLTSTISYERTICFRLGFAFYLG